VALNLRIVTPTRLLVDTEATEVTAPGLAGEFGVLPEHVTFLGQLDLGVLSYVENGTSRRVIVHGGYAEVVDDVVTILADDAELPEEVDAAAARAEQARVEEDLGRVQDDPKEVARLLREQRRAEIRVAAAS
jgi:F-type H+-transporting ATPase subunit epsilon